MTWTVKLAINKHKRDRQNYLSVTSHINCIVARCLIKVVYLTACAFIRSWWHCTFWWRRLWCWIDTNIEKYVIIASLKSETMGKLINRIPGLPLLILSLRGSALIMHVDSLGKPRDVNKRFSKPCLVNLISKDTHLVFSIYRDSN